LNQEVCDPLKFDASLSGNIYALIAAIGMVGSSIFPYGIGKISELSSIHLGSKLLIMPAIILLVVAFYL
jgi:hypothetical protein